MLARVAGPTPTTKEYDGVFPLPNPEKRLAYGYIIKKQEVNGSWT